MQNLLKFFGIIALVAVIGFSMTACDDGSNDNGLNGTSWSRKSTSTTFDFTYTIKFTSATDMTYTQKGWGMVGTRKENYNTTTRGTYVFYPEIQEGWIDCSVFTGGKYVFAIEGNKMQSLTNSTNYTKD